MNEQQRPAPELLIDRVVDRASFMEFLWALAEERQRAEEEETRDPAQVKWGALSGWQNKTISAFLGAGALAFEDGRFKGEETHPSWRELAEFLYLGKIYE